MKLFDVHRHVGYLTEVDWSDQRSLVENHLDVIDRYGVDAAAIMPSHAYPNAHGLADTREVNDTMAAIREDHPEVFPVAFGTVEPTYGEAGLAEVDRIFEELELTGVSWHNRWQRSFVDSPMMIELIERAAAHDGIVLLHTFNESNLEEPWRVFRILDSFPDVDFVVSDVFAGVKEGQFATHWASGLERENVLFDTSGAKHFPRQVERFVEEVGADRILFGMGGYSNNTRTSLPVPIHQLEDTDISREAMRLLTHGNAERFFDISV